MGQKLDVAGYDNEQIERANNYTIREKPRITTSGNNIYLATSSRNFNGSGSPDSLHFHVAKFQDNGVLSWSNRVNFQSGFTGEYYDIDESCVSGIIVHSSGNILISEMHTSWSGSADAKRTFIASFNSSGNYLNNITFEGSGAYQGLGLYGLKKRPDGHIIGFGRSFNMVGTSNNGMALVEIDDNLNLFSANIFNTSGRCRDILFDGSGSSYTLIEDADISEDGSNRTCLIKLDPNLAIQWGWNYGSYQSEKAPFLGEYTNGDFGIISSTFGFSSGSIKAYVIRTDHNRLTAGCSNEIISFTQEIVSLLPTTLVGLESSNHSVSNSNFSEATIELTLNEADIEYTSVVEAPLCHGDQGSIELNMVSTSSPFTFQWSNGTNSQEIIDNSGTYQVLIRDTYGCLKQDTFEIVDPDPINGIVSSTDVSCFGFSDGSIDLTVAGGTPGYNYEWITGQNTEDLTSISGGFYQVTITDANGCLETLAASVIEPNPLSAVIINSEMTSCFDLCDGQLNSLITGGTSPYSLQWNDNQNQTTLIASNLCSGQYLLTATDANGCTTYVNGDVYEPTVLTISLGSTPTECNEENGSAWAEHFGGTQPYS